MAEWTTIPDDVLEPGKPIRSVDAIALRDNPIAIAQGASGAPRVVDGALSTSATNTGRDWVLNRTALAQVGAVGTYIPAFNVSTSVISPGGTIAGSSLLYNSTDTDPSAGATFAQQFTASGGQNITSRSGWVALSGTWRCMGSRVPARVNDLFANTTIWRSGYFLRIS